MADFVSKFWEWYILVLLAGSFVAMFALIWWMQRGKKPDKLQTMGHVWDDDLEEYNNPMPAWWLYMFYITLFFGLGYLLLYPGSGIYAGAFGWSAVGQYEKEVNDAEKKYGPLYEKYRAQDLRTVAQNPEAQKMGRRLFVTYCTNCHSSDAGGSTGYPNLRDNDWLYGGEPETIKASIMNGRTGFMPPHSAMLGQEGVLNVSEYVLSLSGRKVNADAAAAGKEKFGQICAACHGPQGKGNVQMGAANLTDNVWLYGGSQAVVMKTIGDGRKGSMPGHGAFLGEAKVHLLAAYVYSLSNHAETKARK